MSFQPTWTEAPLYISEAEERELKPGMTFLMPFLQGIGMLTQAVGSPDMLEGANAFLEKRKPSFPAPE